MDVTTTYREMVALNADVVGYSALVADDLERMTATMSDYHDLVEREVLENGGTLANFVGDSFMAVFEEPTDALRAAIAITTDVEDRNAGLAASSRARFRMGIDRGPVSVSEAGYHGDALNISARIQAIAPPGGLAVSGRVFQALDEPALRFRPMGRQRLKNIPEETEVYEFVALPSGGGGHPSLKSPLALESPTVAVLQIHTEDADATVRPVARMIRNDLIHRLSQVPELTVVDVDTDEPGSRPAARYMLETGVHQMGDMVRVYATLFDVTTMNVVKSHKRSGAVDRLFEVSDDLADEVAHSIQIELVVGEPAGLYAELGDADSIERVYLGWYHLRSDTREGWAKALELFDQVTRAHPDQPFGYVLAAFALWIGASNDWVPDVSAALIDARSRANKAYAIGDPTGMAQAVEAAVLMSQGSTEEALGVLDEVEVLRPTCDVTYGLQGSVRRYMGEWERAVELLDTAMRLTGINKPWYPTVKATSLFSGGRVEEAAAIADEVVQYQPRNLEALLVLAAAQSEMGLERRARATADRIAELFPAVDVSAWLDKTPYQRREIVERWKSDLTSVGVIDAG